MLDHTNHFEARNSSCSRRRFGALCGGLLGTLLTSGVHDSLSAQERPVAYAMLGRSPTPRHIKSIEILLDPLDKESSPPVVTALAASPEGRFIAAAGDDHGIRIVDLTNGKTIRMINEHTDWIRSLVFAKKGRQLYSAGDDGLVMCFEQGVPVSGRPILDVGFAIRTLALSPEKSLLAIAGFSQQIVLWDLEKNEELRRLQCESRDQRCVRFSVDGNYILCGGRQGELHVWDVDSGRELAGFQEHRGRIHNAVFSPDGTLVTSVGEDRQLIQYDIATQRAILKREIANAKLMSMSLVNENLVAAAGADNSVHLYDALSDDVVAHLRGHFGTVSVMTPCGGYLASGSFDTTVRIWDLESIDTKQIQYAKPVHAPIKVDRKLHYK